MNDNYPLVSVIIPTYKRPNNLRRSIDSVLNQTYKNIQIIIVDDNNPDTQWRMETETLMSEYHNDNISYIRHEKNKNGATARNTGINAATGEFVAFLDDDDWFLPCKINKQVNYMLEHEEYQGCSCGYVRNGDTILLDNKNDFTENILLLKRTPQTPSLLIKRECLKELNGFDVSYIRHQDYEFLLRYFQLGFKLGILDEPLYVNETGSKENIIDGDALKCIKDKFLTQFNSIIMEIDTEKPRFKKRVYSAHYSVVFYSYMKKGEIKKGLNTFIYLFKNAPFYAVKSISSIFLAYARFHLQRLIRNDIGGNL